MEFQEPENDAFRFLYRDGPRSRAGARRDAPAAGFGGAVTPDTLTGASRAGRPPRIQVDARRSRLLCEGRSVTLTHKELLLLTALLEAWGEVVPYARLAEALWGGDRPPAFAVAIRTHAGNLRLKLRATGIHDELIRTVPGRGLVLSSS